MSAAKLLSGSGLRLIALLTGMGISFFMMPFLIRSLGDHWYGVWILVASTLGFYGVFDMGLSSATQRYISQALGQRDEERLNTILSNSIFLYSFIAVIAVVASTSIAFLSSLFFDAPEDAQTFRIIILVMGCTFAIHFVMNAYYGVLTAYLRFDIQATIDIAKTVCRATCIYLIFQLDPSVINLALITVLFDLLAQLLVLKAAQREARWIKPSLRYVNKANIKELMGFGINSFVMFIGQQTRSRGPHFAVAGLLSIASVTLFQVASQLIQYMNQLQSSLLGVLMPSFTRLFGEGKEKELEDNFFFSLKLSALTASCLCGGVIALGQSFITFWIGPGYDQAYYAVAAMAVGYFFVLLHYPSFQLLVALAQHKFFAQFEVIEGLLLIAGAVLAAPTFGIFGVAIAIGAVLAVSRLVVMPILVCKAWTISAGKLIVEITKLVILSVAIQASIYMFFSYFLPEASFFQRLPYAFALYMAGAILFILLGTNKAEKRSIKTTLMLFKKGSQETQES